MYEKPTVFANLSPTDEAACRTTQPRDPSALPSACDPALFIYHREILAESPPKNRVTKFLGM